MRVSTAGTARYTCTTRMTAALPCAKFGTPSTEILSLPTITLPWRSTTTTAGTFNLPQPWHAHLTAFVCVFTCECSGYFDTHHNVFVYKAIDAAWGGASLKSDFGGRSNHHHHSIDLFFSKGFSICSQREVGARAD